MKNWPAAGFVHFPCLTFFRDQRKLITNKSRLHRYLLSSNYIQDVLHYKWWHPAFFFWNLKFCERKNFCHKTRQIEVKEFWNVSLSRIIGTNWFWQFCQFIASYIHRLNWIRNPEQEKSLRRAEIDKSEETGCFVFITSFVFILNS